MAKGKLMERNRELGAYTHIAWAKFSEVYGEIEDGDRHYVIADDHKMAARQYANKFHAELVRDCDTMTWPLIFRVFAISDGEMFDVEVDLEMQPTFRWTASTEVDVVVCDDCKARPAACKGVYVGTTCKSKSKRKNECEPALELCSDTVDRACCSKCCTHELVDVHCHPLKQTTDGLE